MDTSTQFAAARVSAAYAAPTRQWSARSIVVIVAAWLLLQIGGLFTPGLLDDVDSIYTEIAREMMVRHDYVTPYINGVRFFDKPPLMYWMAAASMRVFGAHDWAARLPLALGMLALLLAVYALGIRLFRAASPANAPDRGGFYAALAMATSIGPYLYTRFYIPDILLALWMTLGVHLFLLSLDRIRDHRSTLLPATGFAAVMALNVLTKGLIGLVFPIGFVLAYLAITRQLRLLFKLHLIESTAVFLAIAAPWHILAALRTPPIPLPSGMGLPERGGWAWFYLYNEHIARFLGRRIPHDYGQVPIPLFWLLSALWVMPWTAFLFPAVRDQIRDLRKQASATAQQHETALSLLLWTVLVLGFFTMSSRQEYYNLPALPALALMAAGLLARADGHRPGDVPAQRSALAWSLWFLVPLTTLIAVVCGYFAITAPHPKAGTDIASLLAANPEFYNLSLGHLFDLTGAAMGLFRGPLIAVALSMLAIGLGSYALRRRNLNIAANITLATAMSVTLLAAHEGLARFYPIIGSKGLALSINNAGLEPADQIVLDGELTSGSSLIFYTRHQVHLINGNVNGLWYGSLWPDSPHIFEGEQTLRHLWGGNGRVFLFTYDPAKRSRDLAPYGEVHLIATAGGKTVLSNR
ncbi:MAG: glycosyltransferase family 39 protein [Acidobacteria bacterium]|nr:glycosyltransferase family 39 protein [Acidobacteriota bacterium]